ncbi:MocR-like pyridoxine biosynthesis transcription factor PdxR [Aurantivibrio plasticivorans]
MTFQLLPDLPGALYNQLFESLRRAILEGQFRPSQQLPTSRELSQQLSLSRNTVLTALDMLKAEGYIESVAGSGLYVCSQLPETEVTPPSPNQPAFKTSPISLSKRGSILANPSRAIPTLQTTSFVPGLPDLEHFPFKRWSQCVHSASQNTQNDVLRYSDQGGLTTLKQSLARYLTMSRGVRCDEEQLIVLGGSQAALDLTTRLLLDINDTVAIENPGYLGAREAFLGANAKVIGIDIDAEGLQVDQLAKKIARNRSPIKLLYTTPSNQFPLGTTLSLPRRMALLELAEKENFFILEDDYDSEFRYHQRPINSLQGLDAHQRVIYMGTFSKVLFPGLRLGYLVVPPHLNSAFAQALRKTGQDASLTMQTAVALFMERGYFDSHIRRMRKLYGEKQALFSRLVKENMTDWLEVVESGAGMQSTCFYKQAINREKLQTLAKEKSLILPPLERMYLSKRKREGLYLGYAGIPIADIAKQLAKLQSILSKSMY